MIAFSLTNQERIILSSLKRLDGMVGEDQYHLMHSIIDGAGKGLNFEYELKCWDEVDKEFRSLFGSTSFSHELHSIINSLVSKGYVVRDPENPINIMYERG